MSDQVFSSEATLYKETPHTALTYTRGAKTLQISKNIIILIMSGLLIALVVADGVLFLIPQK